jgi:hypothetical protein
MLLCAAVVVFDAVAGVSVVVDVTSNDGTPVTVAVAVGVTSNAVSVVVVVVVVVKTVKRRHHLISFFTENEPSIKVDTFKHVQIEGDDCVCEGVNDQDTIL